MDKHTNAPAAREPLAAASPEYIDPDDRRSLEDWARRFDASVEQVKDAIQAAGSGAADVEMHLKGTRATSNARREAAADGRC
jgi:hypothetical protein